MPSQKTVLIRPKKASSGGGEWLALYADLITTMMIFFVLLFSMSKLDQKKYLQLRLSLYENLETGSTQQEVPVIKKDPFEPIMQTLNHYIEKEELEEDIQVSRIPKGVLISVEAPVFFKLGQAELEGGAQPFLDVISQALAKHDHQIVIEGHTDDLPMKSGRYRNNWELSTSRASSVVSYFIEHGGIDPTRLQAAGYSQFRPKVPNTSDENRIKNRRVEIKIETTTLSLDEKKR